MKARFSIFFLFAFVLLNIAAPMILSAQEEEQKQEQKSKDDWRSDETEGKVKFPYLKEKYDTTFASSFEDVWNAALKSIEDINCQVITKSPRQDDDGYYKGKIESDFCPFAQGDTTLENLKYFSVEIPFIRGGVWTIGRMQYKFIVKENEDHTVYCRLIGEISAWEDHVTSKVHFFQSNGYFEYTMLERLKKNLAAITK